MRTAGQGQAAVPRERVRRRRPDGCLNRRAWAVGEHLTDCHESGALSRPPLACAGDVRFCRGARSAHRGFVLRERGRVWPQGENLGGKYL